jgi:hypothetical protein
MASIAQQILEKLRESKDSVQGTLSTNGWNFNPKLGIYTHPEHEGHTFNIDKGHVYHKHGGKTKATLGDIRAIKGYLTRFHREMGK